MTNKHRIKNLLVLVLFINFNCLAEENFRIIAERNVEQAPETTPAESNTSFWELPYLKKAFINTTPASRTDGIPVGELGVDGGDKITIVNFAREIANRKYGDYDSLLISHKGKLLFESYYLRGRIDLAHGQASATKAYTSLALGRAIQLGYLTMADLNKPLISFLKEVNYDKLVKGSEKITLHKALTMHGGLSVSDEKWEELQKNPSAIKGQKFIQALLEHSGPITEEAQTFLYGNHNPMLVMSVIDAVVPGTAQEFIKNEILDKLGITNYSWQDHISGLPEAGWRVNMTSRDMLKLGSLILNKGKWNGEQLISAEFLIKANSGLVKPAIDWMPESYRYGYYWYITPVAINDKNYNATFAWGGGGQYVIVVAELDLIIAINGHDREDQILTEILKTVIPAFAK